MKANMQDLTTGSLGKKILCFSVPLMLSNLLQVLFNMVDVAVVGRFAGAMALGSVGSTSILVMMFTGFLIGIAAGINVLTALYFGAKKTEQLSETVHTAALLSVLIGVFLSVLGIVSARPVLQLLKTKPELIEGAVCYLSIYFLGMPALALYNFGSAVLSAAGDTARPLKYLSCSGIANLFLNLFFVLFCGMDVDGVAIASVISQYLSAGLIMLFLFRTEADYGLHWSGLRLHRERMLDLMRIGVPGGLQNAIFHVANLFVQAGVNSFSAVLVAGNSAAANADSLIYDVMAAFYTACGSFMGQNLGAGNRKRVLRSYFVGMAYSFGIGAGLGFLLFVFGREFLSLFTTEPEVIEAGMQRIRIMGFSYGVSAFMDCTIAASRAMGKSVIPTVIVFSGSCVFRVIWIYTVFAHFQTIPSLYLLYIFSWSLTAAAEIVYFVKTYREWVRAQTSPESQKD